MRCKQIFIFWSSKILKSQSEYVKQDSLTGVIICVKFIRKGLLNWRPHETWQSMTPYNDLRAKEMLQNDSPWTQRNKSCLEVFIFEKRQFFGNVTKLIFIFEQCFEIR
jgi:hypothetical protein